MYMQAMPDWLVARKNKTGGYDMLEFKYDTQLLIEGENLDEDTISDYFTENFHGD